MKVSVVTVCYHLQVTHTSSVGVRVVGELLRVQVLGLLHLVHDECPGGGVLAVVLPGGSVDGGRGWRVTGDLLEQLEHRQTDGDEEGEEAELESVPGLESQDAESQRDQSHGLEQHEHQDGDQDLLQLVLAACGHVREALIETEA